MGSTLFHKSQIYIGSFISMGIEILGQLWIAKDAVWWFPILGNSVLKGFILKFGSKFCFCDEA